MKCPYYFSFSIFLYFVVSVHARSPYRDPIYRGCNFPISSLNFECPNGQFGTACTCSSPEYLATYMDCVYKTNESSSDQTEAQRTLIGVCSTSNVEVTIDDLTSAYENATEGNYFVSLETVTGQTATLYNPVSIDPGFIVLSVQSFKSMIYQRYIGQVFGGIVLSYWGLILLIGSVLNLLKHVAPKLVSKCNSRFWLFIRQKFATPATYGYSHSTPVQAWQIFNMTVPTRPQSLVLLGYGIVHLILYFPKYNIVSQHILYTHELQLLRYIGDRSGIMAIAHLPLIFLFAGRNNIMLTFTGWAFETFNAYHRWISRGMYLNVFIHAVCFSRYLTLVGAYPSVFSHERYITWGLVSCIFGGLIMFFSFRHFRDRSHEFFLICHWIFVSIFLAGIWWHIKRQGHRKWLYCVLAIWGFDRACRFIRMIVSGLNAKAQVQYFPDNVMKFRISYSNLWEAKHGDHIYVSILRLTSFWQSHPFSIYRSPTPGEENKIVLCMRTRNGITKSLARKCASQKEDITTLPILIDGPYGQRFPLHNYPTVIFISGGIGVTASFSYVDALKRAGRSEKQRLVFIWIIRNRGEIGWFREEIEYLMQNSDVEIRVFITNQGELDPHTGCSSDGERTVDENASKKEKEIVHSIDSDRARTYDDFNASYSRPDLDDLVSSYIVEANSNIAFFACGPPTMNDDARAYVSKRLSLGKSRVEYFEESFAW